MKRLNRLCAQRRPAVKRAGVKQKNLSQNVGNNANNFSSLATLILLETPAFVVFFCLIFEPKSNCLHAKFKRCHSPL